MRATVQKHSNGKLVALPELSVDLFIGILKPNQHTIDKDSFDFDEEVDTSVLKEDQIIEGSLTWDNKWRINNEY